MIDRVDLWRMCWFYWLVICDTYIICRIFIIDFPVLMNDMLNYVNKLATFDDYFDSWLACYCMSIDLLVLITEFLVAKIDILVSMNYLLLLMMDLQIMQIFMLWRWLCWWVFFSLCYFAKFNRIVLLLGIKSGFPQLFPFFFCQLNIWIMSQLDGEWCWVSILCYKVALFTVSLWFYMGFFKNITILS